MSTKYGKEARRLYTVISLDMVIPITSLHLFAYFEIFFDKIYTLTIIKI